jgi:hypothetical protein
VYLFEGGVARTVNVGPGRRLIVLPWTDLDRVITNFDDEDLLTTCELRGRSGTRLLLGRSNHDGYEARVAVMHAARQVLGARSRGA